MNQNLVQSARKLRLSGLLLSLEMRLQEATSHQLSHDQFLELVLQDELNVRAHRQVERRKKAAAFRELKPLDEFDWDFNPSIKRAQIYELATANFIRQNRDILLLGPPGVGKSCLAQAIGYAAIKAGFVALYCSVFDLQADESPAQAKRTLNRFLKPDLLCIDDFGMKHFPAKSAESLLEIIVRRHQNRSTLMTSNRPIEEWGQPLSDIGHTQTRPVVRRSMRKVSQSPSRLDRDRPRVLVRLNTSDVHALRAIFLDREIELA